MAALLNVQLSEGDVSHETPHPLRYDVVHSPLPPKEGKSDHIAFFNFSARSVFSQEKPPSASGVRPKWP